METIKWYVIELLKNKTKKKTCIFLLKLTTDHNPLTIIQLVGAFLILGFGLLIALIIFLYEILKKRNKISSVNPREIERYKIIQFVK